MAQLICSNVSLGYDAKVIVSGLDFMVNRGDYLCVVGENGSGKSTLMKTILGLTSPLEGKIIMGDDTKTGDIGYLPQQTQAQKDFPASVKEIVMSGCLSKSGMRMFYSRQQKQLAKRNMERMGVDGIADKCYRELSGGQQQRVLLARALCAAGKIMLLDEPVSGLDPHMTAHMYEAIYEINKSDGITIIMISHDISSALKYATHILHIGKNVFFGTKEEYLNSETGRNFLAEGAEGK